MCLDLFLAEQVRQTGAPVLRFYTWQPYCLSLGHHQKQTDVDFEKVKQSGFEMVRRPTGGSAIFHSEELTYSFIVPLNRVSHHDIYHLFHTFLAEALQNCGYRVTLSNESKKGSYLNQSSETFACFNRSARNEIQYKGKKVVGSAQKLLKEVVLQHGSVMLGREHEKIIDFLKIDTQEKEQQRRILAEKSVSLQQILPQKARETRLIDALLDVFEKQSKADFYYQYPSQEELMQLNRFKEQIVIQG